MAEPVPVYIYRDDDLADSRHVGRGILEHCWAWHCNEVGIDRASIPEFSPDRVFDLIRRAREALPIDEGPSLGFRGGDLTMPARVPIDNPFRFPTPTLLIAWVADGGNAYVASHVEIPQLANSRVYPRSGGTYGETLADCWKGFADCPPAPFGGFWV